jgi:hypothetical protein
MDVHIPTLEEIYMIAYITARGWKLDFRWELWTKDKKLRKLSDWELEEFSRAKEDGWHDYHNDPEFWKLEDAFYEELDVQKKGHENNVTD